MSEIGLGERTAAGHKVNITARSAVEITEVTGVVAFDEEEIILETGAGKMQIAGEGMRITVLSLETGVVSAVGKINGIAYLNEGAGKRSGLFSRRG